MTQEWVDQSVWFVLAIIIKYQDLPIDRKAKYCFVKLASVLCCCVCPGL